jgi:hypothetical protein
MFSSGAKVY